MEYVVPKSEARSLYEVGHDPFNPLQALEPSIHGQRFVLCEDRAKAWEPRGN